MADIQTQLEQMAKMQAKTAKAQADQATAVAKAQADQAAQIAKEQADREAKAVAERRVMTLMMRRMDIAMATMLKNQDSICDLICKVVSLHLMVQLRYDHLQ